MIIIGVILVVIGVYGLWRTHDVRPRSPRPELARDLFATFGGITILGIISIILGL